MSVPLVIATTVWGYTHFLAHFGIGGGYLIAMTRNNSTLNSLMRLRLSTKLFGAGFFLFCGVTHFGLALKLSTSPVVTVCDHLQLICIYGFLIGLLLDTRRIVKRLGIAFGSIKEEYDNLVVVRGEEGVKLIESGKGEWLQVGDHVVATINFALHDKGHRPPHRDAG